MAENINDMINTYFMYISTTQNTLNNIINLMQN